MNSFTDTEIDTLELPKIEEKQKLYLDFNALIVLLLPKTGILILFFQKKGLISKIPEV